MTGNSTNSSVGGIAGLLTGKFGIDECNNNGVITGGQYVAGIIGSVFTSDFIMKYCRNSGTIQGNNTIFYELDDQNYIAGIVAYVSIDDNILITHYKNTVYELQSCGTYIYDLLNIGMILGNNFNYAAGIVAYLSRCNIAASSNSGLISGSRNYVGGIVAYLCDSSSVQGCINTNWIGSGIASFVGSIVGYNNNGSVINCCYDQQMSIFDGIGFSNNGLVFQVIGSNTLNMLGYNLIWLLKPPGFNYDNGFGPGCNWDLEDNLYPIVGCCVPSSIYHPITLLAAAPIYLHNTAAIADRLDNITMPFTVSNNLWNGMPYLFDYHFQWNSFSASTGNTIIDIPLAPAINATIIRSGQDTLRVIYDDDPTYEKLIPINVP